MKVVIAFLCFIALTFAEIETSNKYGVHHTQHTQSVNAARNSLQERLQLLEGQNGYNGNQVRMGQTYGSSGSQKYVSGCSSCVGGSENRESYSSRLSSQSSSQRLANSGNAGYGISNSDYSGSGVVGHSNDDDDYEDVQVVVTPAYVHSGSSSSRFSSASAHEADEMQQRVVPGDLNSVSSSAYRASLAEQDENDSQRTVGSGYVGQGGNGYGASRVYSQSRGSGSESSRTGSVAVPVYVSGQRRVASSASQSESEINESRKPVPTGQYVSFAARPGQSTVLAVPVRVLNVQGTADDQQKFYSRSSDQSSGSDSTVTRVLPTSQTYRVTYNPTYISSADRAASTSDSESSRVGSVQTPEKFTNYNSYNALDSASQTRTRAEESDSDLSQTRVAPVTVTYPQNGGSSRYASAGSAASQQGQQQGVTQTRVVAAFPVHRVESSLSSRTAEEREQRRYTPAVPTYISSSSNRQSASELEESRNQQSSAHGGTFYAPVSSQTRFQAQQQSQAGSGSQTQFQRQGFGGNFSPYVPSRSQTSSSSHLAAGQSADRLSTRFGTGVLGSNTDDLHSYISESERLARLQQQQIAGSSSGSAVSSSDANRRTLQTASTLDSAAANFVRSSNIANRNSELDTASYDAGAGGYNKVRSWNKQSKWSSGSEYGPDGKPKSYSTLSTAEAEKYNINGAEAGYKAATTTLENDGKVSTYSIHTP